MDMCLRDIVERSDVRQKLLLRLKLSRTTCMAQSDVRKEMLPEDRYVQTQKELLSMPQDGIKEKLEELKMMCTCPECPTNNDCAKSTKELLFCSTGSSFHCIAESKGCLCPTCPVAEQLGLGHQSFCLMGDEKAQRFDSLLQG